MKHFLNLTVFILCLGSCQSSDELGNSEIITDTLNNDDSTENEPDAPFEIRIDDTDLASLPEDTGGSHTAFPLGSTSANYGHYAYTPSGYTADGPKYPLLIFLHGWNSNLGNESLENVLLSGPPRLIKAGQWNPNYPFIVVSPQLTTPYWAPSQTHRFIEYLLSAYQINPDRIYLTGLSLGGGGCWYYVGEIEDNYAAAIVPISASGAEYLIDNLRKVPIWAFHGARDTTVEAYLNFGSVPLVQAINLADPIIEARLTVYPNLGHNAWTTTYDGAGRNHNQLYDRFDVDLYDWMLTYKKE